MPVIRASRAFLCSLLGGCTAGPVVELALPPEISREWISALEIVALDARSPALLSKDPPSCAMFTALTDRPGHRDFPGLGAHPEFPLEAGQHVLEVEGGSSESSLFVHVVARGPTRQFVGNVTSEPLAGAELQPPIERPIAEACVCLGPSGSSDCLDWSQPQTLTLHDLLASSREVTVTPNGPRALVAVRNTRALLSPGVRVFVPTCNAKDTPGCLALEGAPRLPGLPLSIRVEGEPSARPVAPVILTNAAGDAVPEIEVGDCRAETFQVLVALVGHPAPPVRFDVRCADDLPVARAPLPLATFRGDVRLAVVPTRPATLAVLHAPVHDVTELTWLSSTGTLDVERFDGEDPGDVIGVLDGEPRLVVASFAAGALALRSFGAGARALVALGPSQGECTHSACGAVHNNCSGALKCSHDAQARLATGDIDGDGRQEVSLVSNGGGVTIYDPQLSTCGRITGGPSQMAQTWAMFGGPVREVPTMITTEALAVRVTYPARRSATGPACSDDDDCLGGATCYLPCPDGTACAPGPGRASTGVCLSLCGDDALCPPATACTRFAEGLSACLGPGPSCVQGLTLSTLSSGASRTIAHGRLRPGDFDDVVMLVRGGAPRILWGAAEELTERFDPERDALLVPRTADGQSAPRDARALAVGDVDGDGDDDIVVAYDTSVRTWLGGPGLPGEASAIELERCSVQGLALPDLDDDGKADIVVACALDPDTELRLITRR